MSKKKSYVYFDFDINPYSGGKLPVKTKYRSNSKKAKNIVRSEIMSYYSGDMYGNKKSAFENMTTDIQASYDARESLGKYNQAKSLVDSGCFACYYSDQAKMLAKIFGKKRVSKMSGFEIHNLYSHLIGREYEEMARSNNHGYLKVNK